MMKNEKLLENLADQLEDLKRQVLRMNRNDYEMHRLDIKILQNIIRELYDQVLELEYSFEKIPEANEVVQIPVIPIAKHEKEIVQPEKEIVVEQEVIHETVTIRETEIEVDEKVELKEEISEFPEPEEVEPRVVDFKIELEKKAEKPNENDKKAIENSQENRPTEEIKSDEMKSVRSTIDLFSATGEPSIFDRINHDIEPSIADKMRQMHISDLRQAIGINEKFLFINELFNGDMGKYNKALDELNEMKTKEGVVTYFIEMKIHNQWKEDNEAFIKFKELLDRKIE
jgi:hypothetical protein